MEAALAAGQLPAVPSSTKLDLSDRAPHLAQQVSKWLKKHGKFVKPRLSATQKQELSIVFRLMDEDGSGAIDAEEMMDAFKMLGFNFKKSQICELIAEVAAEGKEEVCYDEFLEIMTVSLVKMAESVAARETQVPMSLVTTAYTRKKLLENVLEGTAESFAQVVQAGEEQKQSREREKLAAEERARQAELDSTHPSESVIRVSMASNLSMGLLREVLGPRELQAVASMASKLHDTAGDRKSHDRKSNSGSAAPHTGHQPLYAHAHAYVSVVQPSQQQQQQRFEHCATMPAAAAAAAAAAAFAAQPASHSSRQLLVPRLHLDEAKSPRAGAGGGIGGSAGSFSFAGGGGVVGSAGSFSFAGGGGVGGSGGSFSLGLQQSRSHMSLHSLTIPQHHQRQLHSDSNVQQPSPRAQTVLTQASPESLTPRRSSVSQTQRRVPRLLELEQVVVRNVAQPVVAPPLVSPRLSRDIFHSCTSSKRDLITPTPRTASYDRSVLSAVNPAASLNLPTLPSAASRRERNATLT